MSRKSPNIHIFDPNESRLSYTEPGQRYQSHLSMQLAPENFYSISNIDSDSNKALVFTHFSKYRQIWEYIILFISGLPLFEISFISIFVPRIGLFKYIPFLICDIIFIIDVFVVTHTAYLSHGVFVSEKRRIIRKYGYKSLIIHIIASIPISWIGIYSLNPYKYILWSLTRLLRIHRALNAADTVQRSLVYDQWYSSILPLIFILILFVHIFACLFYISAKMEGISESWIGLFKWDTLSPPQQYVVSIYFVMTTILTIGYGDLTPKTSSETILVIFIQLIGVMINAYIVGTLVMNLIDPIGNSFLKTFDGFAEYMSFKKIPTKLKHDIKDYFQLIWSKNKGTEDPNFLFKHIPETVRDYLKSDMCKSCMDQVKIFKMGSNMLINAMSDLLQPVSYVPGDIITLEREIRPELLMFNSGMIQIIINGNIFSTQSCSKGVAIGELELFIDKETPVSIKAVTHVSGWSLDRERLLLSLAHRPEIRKELLKKAMLAYPSVYKEIRKLLSTRNLQISLEKKHESHLHAHAKRKMNLKDSSSDSDQNSC